MKKLLLIAFLGCSGTFGFAQTVNKAKKFNIASLLPNLGPIEFQAQEAVKLMPGFTTENKDKLFKAKIDPFISGPIVYRDDRSGEERQLDKSLDVGTIAGAAGVSPSGASTYSFGIDLPPGTNGVVPSIGAAYSSQQGNGILGLGWGLTGLSAITLANKSIYYDRVVERTVPFNNGNTFAYDGQRLLYNDVDQRYYTEQENFSKIEKVGAGNNAFWFKVTTREGVVMEYGRSESSKGGAQNTQEQYVWLINKVTDRNGNYYTYEYDNDLLDTRIKRIEYTGNLNSGIHPYNSVEFYYDIRSDKNVRFVNNRSFKSEHLLRRITTFCEGNHVSNYDFQYLVSTGVSTLVDVIKSNFKNQSINSTHLVWSKSEDQISAEEVHNQPHDFTTNEGEKKVEYKVLPGDYNGDGFQDVVYLEMEKENNTEKLVKWRLYLNDRNNNFPGISEGEIQQFSDSKGWYTNKSSQLGPTVSNADFNGDGKEDFLIAQTGENYIWIPLTGVPKNLFQYRITAFLSTGNGFQEEIQVTSFYNNPDNVFDLFFSVGDFDGNGVTDIFTKHINLDQSYSSKITNVRTGATVTLSNQQQLFHNRHVVPLDFDGDGKTELMTMNRDFSPTRIHSLLPDILLKYASDLPGYPNNDHKYRPGDFNGDGMIDYLISSNGGNSWSIAYNHDNTFEEVPFPEFGSIITNQDFLVSDFNGDGFSDAMKCYQQDNVLKVEVNYFFGYKKHYFKKFTTAFAKYQIYLGDFNGDGIADIMNRDEHGTTSLFYFTSDYQRPDLTSVQDGLNNKVEFLYSYLTNPSVYNGVTSSNEQTFPINCIKAPLKVVQQVKNYLPDEKISTATYNYSNLYVHGQGKGFLGFQHIEVKSEATDIPWTKSKQSSSLNLARAELVPDYSLTLNENGFISQSTLEYTTDVTRTVAGKSIYLTYPSVKHSNDFITGIQAEEETKLSTDPNCLGCLEWTKSTAGISSVTTSYQDYVDNGSWAKYLPQKITSTNSRSGVPDIVRNKSLSYDSKGNVQSKTEFAGSSKPIISTYTYLPEGCVETETLSGVQVDSRTMSFGYDPKRRFQISITNAIGLTASSEIDPRWGVSLSSVDANGLKSSMKYDGWGRMTSSISPTGVTSGSVIEWASETINDSRLIFQRTFGEGTDETKVYYDPLMRQVASEGVNFKKSTVLSEQSYTALGEQSISSNVFTDASNKVLTTNTYDNLRRPLLTEIQGLSQVGYSYAGLTSAVSTAVATNVSTVDQSGLSVSNRDGIDAVNYTSYNALGQPTTINPPGKEIIITYDEEGQGQQTSLLDPDAGKTEYNYNGFGELKYQKDAENNITSNLVYDKLGRLTDKTQKSGTTGAEVQYHYTYFDNNAPTGKGLLKSVSIAGHTTEYVYDEFSRKIGVTETVSGVGYTTKYEYDKFNRVIRKVYPSGYTIKNVFNDKGYLTDILDETRNKTLWKIKDIYPDGKIKTVEKGDGIFATHKFDVHGFDEGYAVKKGENLIADWGYEWDKPKGQLFKRVNNKRPILFETFSYEQDRLSKVIRPDGSYSCDIEYSDNKQSQIKEKSDFGKYTYDPNNTPNALREVELVDGVAGQVPQIIEYNAFNSANDIKHQQSGDHLQIVYGNDEQRVSSLLTTTLGEVSKTFLGGYEIISTNGETRQIHYLQAPDGLLGMYVTSSNGGSTFYYAFTDYQGTIRELTDENGVVKFEQSFDAWGNSRNPESWQLKTGENSFSSFSWVRGYTMHESLPEFGLINMNGRMYDPKTGMMLSPDNYVSDATSTIAYNRFLYCNGNPFKYTDPSGEWVNFVVGGIIGGFSGWQMAEANGAKGWKKFGYIVGGAVIGAASSGAASGVSALGGGAFIAGASAGVVGGGGFAALGGGNAGEIVRGAGIGFISGGLGGAVGAAFGGGFGAIAGGAAGSAINSKLQGASWEDAGISAFAGGALAFGTYHASSYLNYQFQGGNKMGGMQIRYNQFLKMQAAIQRSMFDKKEHGFWLTNKGTTAEITGNAYDINLGTAPSNAIAEFHTHWDEGGIPIVQDVKGGPWMHKSDFQKVNAGKIGIPVLSGVTYQHHSPLDLGHGYNSIVINRYDGSFYPGTGAMSNVQPFPTSLIRYNFSFFFWR